MKNIFILCCLFFISCKSINNIQAEKKDICLKKEDLKIKKDVFIIKADELTQKFIEPILINESKCIGLYIIGYVCANEDLDLIQVPILKMENEILFSEWENEDINKANAERFKSQYKDVFSSDELNKIVSRFMIGIRITAHI